MPTLAINKKARYDYEILDTFEAGLVLHGHEVKSAKQGDVNLKGSYVTLTNGKAQLLNAYITAYKKAGPLPDYDPYRSRDLLLKRSELDKLFGKKDEAGITLVPLKLYTKYNKIKLEFGIGRGKKKHDKRQDIKQKDLKRRMKKEFGV